MITDRAAFFLGAGIMGVGSGLGIGGTAPNKWALLIGVGSLLYANELYPMVDWKARPELSENLPSLPDLPSVPDFNNAATSFLR